VLSDRGFKSSNLAFAVQKKTRGLVFCALSLPDIILLKPN